LAGFRTGSSAATPYAGRGHTVALFSVKPLRTTTESHFKMAVGKNKRISKGKKGGKKKM
jgi:hypothetical protein